MEQLWDAMIFNDDPPTCMDCQDKGYITLYLLVVANFVNHMGIPVNREECGGPSRCVIGCGALFSNKIAVCPKDFSGFPNSAVNIEDGDKENRPFFNLEFAVPDEDADGEDQDKQKTVAGMVRRVRIW
ncbi:hypothetical protein RHSIM_Rhsim08G0184200 [Rhododendron simsii]|uniref:Uncharacterized protein n=1 Tax=Rhododendron simsii TaxID=118357 RepID=A0A834GPP7_RHOSS|nr:hypothetical protein RHSIM_Rhsim08G0184200 [Rhododendron simsii]